MNIVKFEINQNITIHFSGKEYLPYLPCSGNYVLAAFCQIAVLSFHFCVCEQF